MANKKLEDYIQSELDAGHSKEVIKETLLGVGWQKEDIAAAFASLDEKEEVPVKSLKKSPKQFSKKPVIIAILAIFIFCSVAFGGFYLWKRENPKEALFMAMQNMNELDTIRMIADLNLETKKSTNGQTIEVDMVLSQMIDEKNKQAEFDLQSDVQIDEMTTELALNIFYVDDNLFAKITEFSGLQQFGLPLSAQSGFVGKNILVVENLTEGLDEEFLSLYSFNLEEIIANLEGELDEEKVEKMMARMLDDLKQEILVEDKIYQADYLGQDTFQGEELKKYKLRLDIEEFIDFYIDMIIKYGEEIATITGEDIEYSPEEFKKQLEKEVEEVENLYQGNILEAYVWTDGKYIRRAEMEPEINEKFLEEEEFDYLDLYFSFEFRDFNQSLNLETPSDYIEIDQVIAEVMGLPANQSPFEFGPSSEFSEEEIDFGDPYQDNDETFDFKDEMSDFDQESSNFEEEETVNPEEINSADPLSEEDELSSEE